MLEFPKLSGNRIKLKNSEYLKAVLIVLLIIFAIVVYVFQFDHFDKMLNAKYFLFTSLGLGLALGIFIGRPYAEKEHDLVDRMRIYMTCAGLCVVFMPLVICLVNRYLDFREPRFEMAQVLELRAKTDQPFGYLKDEEMTITYYKATVLIGEDIFKFKTKEHPFPQKQEGDMVQVPICQGLLGMEYLSFK